MAQELSMLDQDIVKDLNVIIAKKVSDPLAVEELSSCESLKEFGIRLYNLVLEKPDVLNDSLSEIACKVASLGPLGPNYQECCADPNLISVLVKSLSNKDTETQKQACRALGNLCYDDEGSIRLKIHESGGTEALYKLLKSFMECKENVSIEQLKIASGFLMNYVLGCEEAVTAFLQDDIVKVLVMLLQDTDDETLVYHILTAVSCINDSDAGQAQLLKYRNEFSSFLGTVFGKKNDPDDVLDSCLELAVKISEDDDGKVSLVIAGACEQLIKKLQSSVSDSSSEINSFVRQACDLIVLVTSGDESMELLFQDGQGPAYLTLRQWLLSRNENLLVAGTLSMGNFARKDKNCEILVKQDVPKYLLSILQNSDGILNDIRLQHAVFSTLRNLAVATSCSNGLIEAGVLDVTIPLASVIKSYPVVFKYIGMIRILCSHKDLACATVGKNEAFIKQIISWANVGDFHGVKEESSRCIAEVMRHSKDSIPEIIKNDGLQPVTEMLTSVHGIMHLEALRALHVVASVPDNSFAKAFLSVDVLKKVLDVVSKPENDVVYNHGLQFLKLLGKYKETKSLLQDESFESLLENCPSALQKDVKHILEELMEN